MVRRVLEVGGCVHSILDARPRSWGQRGILFNWELRRNAAVSSREGQIGNGASQTRQQDTVVGDISSTQAGRCASRANLHQSQHLEVPSGHLESRAAGVCLAPIPHESSLSPLIVANSSPALQSTACSSTPFSPCLQTRARGTKSNFVRKLRRCIPQVYAPPANCLLAPKALSCLSAIRPCILCLI